MDEASLEEDASAMETEGNVFAAAVPFLPPPPRPIFLEESVVTDGLTTCDLCTWAQRRHDDLYGYESASKEVPAGLGWVLTLVIVSLTSALIGAIVMIVVLHCRRLKSSGGNESGVGFSMQHRPPIDTPDDKDVGSSAPTNFRQGGQLRSGSSTPPTNGAGGVWSWLAKKSTPTSQLGAPTTTSVENHYTHMDDGYNIVGEDSLYAELDRESYGSADIRGCGGGSPAYQNSAYADPEGPSSSAPSSAYYSDLSTTTLPDRAYEVVGHVAAVAPAASWEQQQVPQTRPVQRLAAINENSAAVPSDYV